MRDRLYRTYESFLQPGLFASALAAIWIVGAGLLLWRDGLTYAPVVLLVGAGALIRGNYWRMRAQALFAVIEHYHRDQK